MFPCTGGGCSRGTEAEESSAYRRPRPPSAVGSGPALKATAVVFVLTAASWACGSGDEREAGGPADGAGTEGYLAHAWERYREQYLRAPGYVVDTTRERAPVTSEGQGYALLRAALIRDRRTFERVFRWTERHLRREDGLYSWLYHPDSGVVDRNTAADADQEIALALIVASHVFGRPTYRERARELLAAVRRREAVQLPKGWFPSAGNWAVAERILNLSYFLPYAYPYFDRIHPEGNWLAARSAGYRLLHRWLDRPGTRLVPDFLRVGPEGAVRPVSSDSELGRTFSYDAVRLYWRVAVDCRLFARPRPCSDPVDTDVLAGLIARDGGLMAEYTPAGRRLSEVESPSFYGAVLPALDLHRPELAHAVRRTLLSPARRDSLLTRTGRYYDRNWVWFGLAAADGFLEGRLPPPAALPRGGETPDRP